MKPPSEKPRGKRKDQPAYPPLAPHEVELTDFFVRMGSILGVQRSVAEIYSLLYASPKPLDFDHIQGRLEMSQGSVSQGLKFLRDHGMILSLKEKGTKRERWEPTPSLAASLVNILRSQVLPSLEKSKPSLQNVLDSATARSAGPEVIERIARLQRWNSRAVELSALLLPPPASD
jgi:DNA-binding transcriptional regulator GbsR (MarR family)